MLSIAFHLDFETACSPYITCSLNRSDPNYCLLKIEILCLWDMRLWGSLKSRYIVFHAALYQQGRDELNFHLGQYLALPYGNSQSEAGCY